MLRVDTWTRSLFQRLYDALWDAFAIPIGTFRLFAALAPLAVDWCLQAAHSTPGPSVVGACFFLCAICVFYDPFSMLEDNRRQARGAYASLNAASHGFAQRTLALRVFYIAVVYARCIKVSARRERQGELRWEAGPVRS